MMDDFMDVREAARTAGVSPWTVRRWLTTGRLTRFKAGSRTVIRRSEMAALIEPKAAALPRKAN